MSVPKAEVLSGVNEVPYDLKETREADKNKEKADVEDEEFDKDLEAQFESTPLITRIPLGTQKDRQTIIYNQETLIRQGFALNKQQYRTNKNLAYSVSESSALVRAQRDFILKLQDDRIKEKAEDAKQKWTALTVGGITSAVFAVVTIATGYDIAVVFGAMAAGTTVGGGIGGYWYETFYGWYESCCQSRCCKAPNVAYQVNGAKNTSSPKMPNAPVVASPSGPQTNSSATISAIAKTRTPAQLSANGGSASPASNVIAPPSPSVTVGSIAISIASPASSGGENRLNDTGTPVPAARMTITTPPVSGPKKRPATPKTVAPDPSQVPRPSALLLSGTLTSSQNSLPRPPSVARARGATLPSSLTASAAATPPAIAASNKRSSAITRSTSTRK